MGADGPAVGVGGHHRPPGKTHHVPRSPHPTDGTHPRRWTAPPSAAGSPGHKRSVPAPAAGHWSRRDGWRSSTPGSAAARPSHRQCPAAGCRSPAARRPRCSAAPPPCPVPRPRPPPPRCGRGGCAPDSPPSPAGTADGAERPAPAWSCPPAPAGGSDTGQRTGRSGQSPRPAPDRCVRRCGADRLRRRKRPAAPGPGRASPPCGSGGWCRSVRQNRESYVSPQNAFSMYSMWVAAGECAPSV